MVQSIVSQIRWQSVLIWALRVLLAVVFLSEGLDKFSERRRWLRIFEEIGFGQWFRYFTGVIEVVAAVMLVIPKTTLVAVALLVGTMLGAILVHVFVMGIGPQTGFVVILIALLITVGRSQIKGGARGRIT